jgi:hypothetical protein
MESTPSIDQGSRRKMAQDQQASTQSKGKPGCKPSYLIIKLLTYFISMSIAGSMILSKDTKIMFQVCWMKQRQGSHLTSVENPSMLHLQVRIMKTQKTYVHSLTLSLAARAGKKLPIT